MQTHLCIQCIHYKPSETPSGYCNAVDKPVWSRRPECAAPKPLDLFEPMNTIGNSLRAAREAAGKNRDEVCMEFNILGRTLQNWELDTNKPPAHTIKMLVDYYEKNEKSKNN